MNCLLKRTCCCKFTKLDPITESSLKMVNKLVYLFFFCCFFLGGSGGEGWHVKSRRSLEHEFKRLV